MHLLVLVVGVVIVGVGVVVVVVIVVTLPPHRIRSVLGHKLKVKFRANVE